MRVITGIARGHKLTAPEGLNTRPTSDRTKEALFSMISYDVESCDFLDLFSGSGAIGIEAISRGADKAVFVEKNEIAYNCIIDNLKHTKLYDKAKVYKKEVNKALYDLKKKKDTFDIIFMDPPYYENNLLQVLQIIKNVELLNDEGYVIIESARNLTVDEISGYEIFKTKKYGKAVLTFLRSLR